MTYKDPEIIPFYTIVVGVPTFVMLLAIFQSQWPLVGLLLLAIFGFLFFGWPLKAEAQESGDVIFIGPIRKTKITAQTLVSVKGVRLYDYRSHLVLRTKHGLPIGYRHTRYIHAPELAQAVMGLIEKSQPARIDSDALKSLEQLAKRAK